jgi:ABC-type Fe3+ transport system permease subunit
MKKAISIFFLLLYFLILFIPFFSHLRHLEESGLLKINYFFFLDIPPEIKSVLIRSLKISIFASLLSLFIGGLGIFILKRVSLRYKKILYLGFFLPLSLPIYIITIPLLDFVKKFFNPYNSPLFVALALGFALYPISALIILLSNKLAIKRRSGIGSWILIAFIILVFLAISEPATHEFLGVESYSTKTEFQLTYYQTIDKKLLQFSPPVLTITFISWLFLSLLFNGGVEVKSQSQLNPRTNKNYPLSFLAFAYVGILFTLCFLIPVSRALLKVGSLYNFIYAVKTSILENTMALFLSVVIAGVITIFAVIISYLNLLNKENPIFTSGIKNLMFFGFVISSPLLTLALLSFLRTSVNSYTRPLIVYPLLWAYMIKFLSFAIVIIYIGAIWRNLQSKVSLHSFFSQLQPWVSLSWLTVFFLSYSDIFFFGYHLSPPEFANLASRGEAFLHLNVLSEGYALLVNQQLILFLFILLIFPPVVREITKEAKAFS